MILLFYYYNKVTIRSLFLSNKKLLFSFDFLFLFRKIRVSMKTLEFQSKYISKLNFHSC